ALQQDVAGHEERTAGEPGEEQDERRQPAADHGTLLQPQPQALRQQPADALQQQHEGDQRGGQADVNPGHSRGSRKNHPSCTERSAEPSLYKRPMHRFPLRDTYGPQDSTEFRLSATEANLGPSVHRHPGEAPGRRSPPRRYADPGDSPPPGAMPRLPREPGGYPPPAEGDRALGRTGG